MSHGKETGMSKFGMFVRDITLHCKENINVGILMQQDNNKIRLAIRFCRKVGTHLVQNTRHSLHKAIGTYTVALP